MRTPRKLIHALTIVALTLVVALPHPVSAAVVTTSYVAGPVTQGQWEFYYTQRTTNAPPYRISLDKTDGPELDVFMRGCGPSASQGAGPVVRFPNADPTGPLRLRETRTFGITFCLAAYSYGNNPTDTFGGDLAWWVQKDYV